MAYGKKILFVQPSPNICICVRVCACIFLLASSRMLLISLVSYTQRESKPKPETNQIESRRHIWESRQHVFVQYLISYYNTTDTWVQQSKIILHPTPAPSAFNHFEPVRVFTGSDLITGSDRIGPDRAQKWSNNATI